MGNKKSLKEILEKLLPKSFPKKNQLLIVLLVGILLIVIALPTGSKRKTASEDTENTNGIEKSGTNEEYENMVERKLEKALKEVKGVGGVKVMVTLQASSEKVVEKDVEKSSQSEDKTDKEGGKSTTKESTSGEATVYSGSETDSQTPYISKELSPKVEGVIVIAEGGDNAVVVKDITEAIQALFDVESHKIKVMKKN